MRKRYLDVLRNDANEGFHASAAYWNRLRNLQEWLNVIAASEGGGGGTSIVEQINIAAPVDAVWQALTDPTELTRWLPLDAQVTPGQGGSILMSWRDPVFHQSTIDIWQPNQSLFRSCGQRRYGDCRRKGIGASDGRPLRGFDRIR